MSDKKPKRDLVPVFFWSFYLLVIVGGLFAGFVKFMAWWRIAFGDLS